MEEHEIKNQEPSASIIQIKNEPEEPKNWPGIILFQVLCSQLEKYLNDLFDEPDIKVEILEEKQATKDSVWQKFTNLFRRTKL